MADLMGLILVERDAVGGGGVLHQSRCRLSVEKSEVYRFGELPVGLGDVAHRFAEHGSRSELVKVGTGFVRIDHLRFTSNCGCRTKLNLRVVGNDEPHALGCGEGFTDFTASDVLQVGFP